MPNPLAIAPFATWTYQDCVNALEKRLPEDYLVLRRYGHERKHFHEDEWIGPGNAATNKAIEKQFAPDDAVGEALYNISNAFREPQLGGAPLQMLREDEQVPEQIANKIAEAKSLLSTWWDKRLLQEVIQERLRVSAWSGFAGIRPWIPGRFLQKEGTAVSVRPMRTFEEALEAIFVSTPLPEHGAIIVHMETQDKCSIFLDEEVIYDNGQEIKKKRAELVYLDPNRLKDEDATTFIRVIYDDPMRTGYTAPLQLGGRILFSELKAKGLLTDSVLRSQRQLNFYSSIITRMGETASFRERYTKNVKPYGRRILYEDGDEVYDNAYIERDDEGREWQIIPTERTLGAGTTTDLIGLPKYNEQGNPAGFDTPDVTIVDPVDPTPYINAGESIRRRVLRMCGQGHLAGTSNFEVSGIAYEQARAVFEKDLNARRISEEGALRDLFTSVLALAEFITRKPGYFTKSIRITVDQSIDAGPRSPDSARLDLESAEAGLLSKETTMSRLGVEDVVAELSRIKQSPTYVLDLLARASELGQVLDMDTVVEALKKMGLPSTVLEGLKKKEEPKPATPPPSGNL